MRNIPLDEFSGMVNFPSWSLIVPMQHIYITDYQ